MKPAAPEVPNNRHRICWSDEGVQTYQSLVLSPLSSLIESWSSSPSRNNVSLLLESATAVLTSAAQCSDKSFPLNMKTPPRSKMTPRDILLSKRKVLKAWKELKNVRNQNFLSVDALQDATSSYKSMKNLHRKLLRRHKIQLSIARDESLLANPGLTYSRIKQAKRAGNLKINKLTVGQDTYYEESVKDGIYHSIAALKKRNLEKFNSSVQFSDYVSEYGHIIELCRKGKPLPMISEVDALKLLKRMKPNVPDISSLTPNHFLLAGPVGWKLFALILNSIIVDISNSSIPQINLAYACVLHKGHNKDRTSSKSYRTISSCPVIAKALDMHVRDLHLKEWNEDQSVVQFQGEGSSHELAALLLTECILFSTITQKTPLFVLYLDAQAAFDVVQPEILIRNLYHVQQQADQSLIYINNRLFNRETVVDWDGHLMGPIDDEQGLEQGGQSSSDFYKIYGKEQLSLAQNSGLGFQLGNLMVGAIGQADDTILISQDLVKLQYQLHLTNVYCSKHCVNLSAEKTKLQVFTPPKSNIDLELMEVSNPINVSSKPIPFSPHVEHVGVLRSPKGNIPSLLARFTAHRKALAGVLHEGMARGHRGNPCFSLKLATLYATPVLLSGLASLYISKKELDMIDCHYRNTLQCLLRLHKRTPQCVVYFLSGSLPGSALLHLRQLSVFGMICRMPDNILHTHAVNIYSSVTISKVSWFHQIRQICLQYGLPYPLDMLTYPMEKFNFKKLVKSKVISYWEIRLRKEAELLTSLSSFKPSFMSLTRPHPLWTTAGHSPRKVAMALVQALMLSGRYRTNSLLRHWSSTDGSCSLSVECKNILEDIPHILAFCPAFEDVRSNLIKFTRDYILHLPPLFCDLVLTMCCPSNPRFSSFLLDCSTFPETIQLVQVLGADVLQHLFHITRTWVYALHRKRLKLLGLWQRASN